MGSNWDEEEEEDSFEVDVEERPSKLQKIEIEDDDDDEDNNDLSLNPFEIDVILGVLFECTPTEDLRKCRLISSQWNEFVCKELSKRRQKSIVFTTNDDLEEDGKLGQLINLTTHQDYDDQKMVHLTSFSFDINLLSSPQIDLFFTKFSPKFVKIGGSYGIDRFCKFLDNDDENIEELERERERAECTAHTDIFNFLIKISQSVQDIEYTFRINSDFTPVPAYNEQLSTTRFPNLRKITLACRTEHPEEFNKMIFYSIVGGNGPKFHHLRLFSTGLGLYQGSHQAMVEISKTTGIMSKLKILEFYNVDKILLDVFTEFGVKGILQLVKFKYDNSCINGEVQGFINFLTSQCGSLKFLHILRIEEFMMGKYREYRGAHAAAQGALPQPSQRRQFNYDKFLKFRRRADVLDFIDFRCPRLHRRSRLDSSSDEESENDNDGNRGNDPPQRPPSPPLPQPIIQQSFPQLLKLSHLQIDYFTSFTSFFEPLNFNVKFPKLEHFGTHNMEGFLKRDAGHSGDLIKSIIIFKNRHMGEASFEDDVQLDFTKLGEIFKNPEFLELNSCALPKTGSPGENIPFWMGLEKVVIHFEMKDLISINLLLLRVIRKLELDVNCGTNLIDEDYMVHLGRLIREESDDRLDNYNQKKFYEKFLSTISRACCIHPASFKIIGHKISEMFKRDLRSIFPECIFVEAKK